MPKVTSSGKARSSPIHPAVIVWRGDLSVIQIHRRIPTENTAQAAGERVGPERAIHAEARRGSALPHMALLEVPDVASHPGCAPGQDVVDLPTETRRGGTNGTRRRCGWGLRVVPARAANGVMATRCLRRCPARRVVLPAGQFQQLKFTALWGRQGRSWRSCPDCGHAAQTREFRVVRARRRVNVRA